MIMMMMMLLIIILNKVVILTRVDISWATQVSDQNSLTYSFSSCITNTPFNQNVFLFVLVIIYIFIFSQYILHLQYHSRTISVLNSIWNHYYAYIIKHQSLKRRVSADIMIRKKLYIFDNILFLSLLGILFFFVL